MYRHPYGMGLQHATWLAAGHRCPCWRSIWIARLGRCHWGPTKGTAIGGACNAGLTEDVKLIAIYLLTWEWLMMVNDD